MSCGFKQYPLVNKSVSQVLFVFFWLIAQDFPQTRAHSVRAVVILAGVCLMEMSYTLISSQPYGSSLEFYGEQTMCVMVQRVSTLIAPLGARSAEKREGPSNLLVEGGCLLEINLRGEKGTFSGSILVVIIVRAQLKNHKKVFPESSTYFQFSRHFQQQ